MVQEDHRSNGYRYCDYCRETLHGSIRDVREFTEAAMKEARGKVPWAVMTILVIVILAVMGYFSNNTSNHLSEVSTDVKTLMRRQSEMQRSQDSNTMSIQVIREKLANIEKTSKNGVNNGR